MPFPQLHLRSPKPIPPSLYPKELNTLGDWIRKTRLDQRLTQEQVSLILGVTECCVTNWELYHSEPEIRYYPEIIAFVGYCPYALTSDLIERLKLVRKALGLTQRQLASKLQVDQATIAGWERKEHQPGNRMVERIKLFLASLPDD